MTAITESDTKGFAAIGILGTAGIAIVLGFVTYAFVIVKLWAWFIVPTFHVAPLALTTAIGIDLIATALRPPDTEPTKDEESTGAMLGRAFGRVLLVPGFILASGAIVRLFV